MDFSIIISFEKEGKGGKKRRGEASSAGSTGGCEIVAFLFLLSLEEMDMKKRKGKEKEREIFLASYRLGRENSRASASCLDAEGGGGGKGKGEGSKVRRLLLHACREGNEPLSLTIFERRKRREREGKKCLRFLR